MKEPLILHLDTGGVFGQFGISRGNELIAQIRDTEPQKQSAHISGFVNRLLSETGLEVDSLNAIAVVAGPGSFTGLRIGTSFAKGMAFSLGIPLVSCSLLQALNLKNMRENPHADSWVSLVPAGADRVFARADGLIKYIDNEYFIKDIMAWQNQFQKTVFSCNMSDLNNKYANSFIPEMSDVVSLCVNKYYSNIFEELAFFEPTYISPFRSGSKNK
jgi:tRNA threonylcarbamoyladenosine biosynthesis protein TsaB